MKIHRRPRLISAKYFRYVNLYFVRIFLFTAHSWMILDNEEYISLFKMFTSKILFMSIFLHHYIKVPSVHCQVLSINSIHSCTISFDISFNMSPPLALFSIPFPRITNWKWRHRKSELILNNPPRYWVVPLAHNQKNPLLIQTPELRSLIYTQQNSAIKNRPSRFYTIVVNSV